MSNTAKEKIAIYAGTFDPVTNGHIDIISRGLRIFDRIYIAVASSTPKNALFTVPERVELLQSATKNLAESARLNVASFEGLLVDYVKSIGATAIIRGLRAVSDYEYEAQMALINRHLAHDVETVFLVTSDRCMFISSSIVKEVARNGGDVSSLVPAVVAERLKEKFKK